VLRSSIIPDVVVTVWPSSSPAFCRRNGTKVVYDRRYVDNGKIITTAGLSAGIDGALHLVSKILGKGRAQTVALGLEYNWDPEGKWARAILADRYLPDGLRGTKPRIKGAKTTLVSTANKPQLQWTFADDQERAWNGTCVVEPSAETKGDFLVTVKLARSRKAAAT